MRAFSFLAILLIIACQPAPLADPVRDIDLDLFSLERERVLAAAESYLLEEAVTVTASFCERSAGGPHDFYSEGDYWWPNPEDPSGPYIRRDGESNPENFKDHRRAMVRFGVQVPSLVAAYELSGDEKYASKALEHVRAWFIDSETRMNPALNYGQAISGKVTGRGVGIIDTIHLVEVALSVQRLIEAGLLDGVEARSVIQWFEEYLFWMTTHEYGIDEMNRLNNHGTCWILQVAAFSEVTANDSLQQMCRDRFKDVLLPSQLAEDGSFPKELARTKPYGYALFNLDVMAGVLQLLSTGEDNLWDYKLEHGAGFEEAMNYMLPYITDKSSWPLEPDVMYWEEWPIRHPSLLFGGITFNNRDAIDLWMSLEADPEVEEVVRNFPIRQPLLWF